MSRVGKVPIKIPQGVEFSIVSGSAVAKGKLGVLERKISSLVKVVVEGENIVVSPSHNSNDSRALWGTERANLQNLVSGVNEGFKKELEINGVGYRAQVQGGDLILQLGFSHEVRYVIPSGINIVCEKPTLVTVSGMDRQKVGQVAAEIRSYRKPEPYKGKGVKYVNESVFRKEGKKK